MKKLLIVIDYQKDFVNGALGFEGASSVEAAICKKIESYRKEEQEVVYTLDTHDEDYLNTPEGKNLPVPHCFVGTEGWQLEGKVAKALTTQDVVFIKPTFGSLELGNYLKENGYEQVELCGLVSYICVFSNAVIAKAALPYSHIIVDALACNGPDKEMEAKAYDILENLHITVLNRGN